MRNETLGVEKTHSYDSLGLNDMSVKRRVGDVANKSNL